MDHTEGGQYCPACERSVDAFAPGPGGRKGARCPRCQALERHRFLALLLRRRSEDLRPDRRVLDIAPHAPIRRILTKDRPASHYVSLDIDTRLKPALVGSLTELPLDNATIDLTVCFHVLEHIPDDGAAMSELARVLSPEGVAFIQVPYKPNVATDEDPSAGPDERIKRFGQIDHIRWYGYDFETRLTDAGLVPTIVTPKMMFSPTVMAQMGLIPESRIWVCRTSAVPSGWQDRRELERRAEEAESVLAKYRSHPVIRSMLATRRVVKRMARR